MRDAIIAVVADLAFTSSAEATMPRARFWFGQMMNQTLAAMIRPSHMPMPIVR